MAEKIDKLEKTVVKGFEDLKEDLKCFQVEANRKYASKQTETIVYGMVGVILLVFLKYVIEFVIN